MSVDFAASVNQDQTAQNRQSWSVFTNHPLPFPKRKIVDASKLKEFADDNFKLDENGRKFSKRVQNSFLLFPQCFQKIISFFILQNFPYVKVTQT